jgi:hypothetical protein
LKFVLSFLLGAAIAVSVAIQAYWTDWPVTILLPDQVALIFHDLNKYYNLSMQLMALCGGKQS